MVETIGGGVAGERERISSLSRHGVRIGRRVAIVVCGGSGGGGSGGVSDQIELTVSRTKRFA